MGWGFCDEAIDAYKSIMGDRPGECCHRRSRYSLRGNDCGILPLGDVSVTGPPSGVDIENVGHHLNAPIGLTLPNHEILACCPGGAALRNG